MLQLIDQKQYHYHQATIDTYKSTKRNAHVFVFYSYSTPQIIIINDDLKGSGVYQVDKKFSSTTSRQVNRFINENNFKSILQKVSAEKFIELCDHLGIMKGRLTW